jgi:hypothetical protein
MIPTVPAELTNQVAYWTVQVDEANARVLRALTLPATERDLTTARQHRDMVEKALDLHVNRAHALLGHDQDAINEWAEQVAEDLAEFRK